MIVICTYQSFSVLLVTGPTDKKITVAPRKFLHMDGGDQRTDAKYITPDAKIDKVKDVLTQLRDELLDFSSVPIEAISTSRSKVPESGYALKIRRIPIEDLYKQRRLSYGPALKKLAKMVIAVNQKYQGIDVKQQDVKVNVQFSETGTELSAPEQIASDNHNLANNTISAIDIMMRNNPDMTEDEARVKIAENKQTNSNELDIQLRDDI